MKRVLVLLMAVTLVLGVGGMTVVYGGAGPAPNSGDGVPDGSGFGDEMPLGPMGDGEPLGPAPGTLDGSGI